VTFQPRVEDQRHVTGKGRFVDDDRPVGSLASTFVRSPHAFATIKSINAEAARKRPGVRGVFTSRDMAALGIGNVSHARPLAGRNGTKLKVPFRPALADERVLHVGQAVVLIVADSLFAAHDAADFVEIEYEALPAVVSVQQAVKQDSPTLWESIAANTAIDWPGPIDNAANDAEVARILSTAPHVASISAASARLAVASMEPRGAFAHFDPARQMYTLRCGSQGAGALCQEVASTMGVPPESVVVLTEDVGGAFGMKTPLYPEYISLLAAARSLKSGISWMSSRSEAFVSDNQARDTITIGKLALDNDGRFLALQMDVLADMGAFLTTAGAFIATSNFSRCLSTVYAIPRVAVRVRCVFTNSLPTGPYRGAGRPEANYAMERLVENASKILEIDSILLRRRNFITADSLPYKTPVGTVIDSGDFEAVLDQALSLSKFSEFPERRTAAAAFGKLRGIGLSCFLEHSGGALTEAVSLVFPGSGQLSLVLSVQASGQGHETVFGRLVAERLGISPTRITVTEGDTRQTRLLGGTSTASRSTTAAGATIVRAVEILIEKAIRAAADMLEAGPSDIEYSQGFFTVKGTDRKLSLFVLAEASRVAGEKDDHPLNTTVSIDVPQTFPNGCHVAEVEIDPETGSCRTVSYTAVDDSGHLLEPVLEGQIHGGVAQGIGQALFEQVIYDADNGQLVTGSFTDYSLPRATDIPAINAISHPSLATTNPLGLKGAGESGTTGSLAAIVNAIENALPRAATGELDMPITSQKIWRACRGKL
jgi:aerobic carbon-monoxide dehydrogenase large subunit